MQRRDAYKRLEVHSSLITNFILKDKAQILSTNAIYAPANDSFHNKITVAKACSVQTSIREGVWLVGEEEKQKGERTELIV